MDLFIFDFEEETVEISNDEVSVTEHVEGLASRKGNILASAGIAFLDLSEIRILADKLVKGEIDQDEFIEQSMSIALDAFKSHFHENLN